ncbi:MAG: DUF4349 domain-containing protein [Chloroflexota bacterium]
MAPTTNDRNGIRVRPIHLVLTLLAVVVLSACGNALVRTESAAQADGLVGFTVDGTAAGLVAAAPLSLAAGEALNEEGRRSFAAEKEAGNAGDDALIVRTASLELEVEDVAEILIDARGEVATLGGYVAGSDEYDQGDRRWASVVYRVPVDRFTEALDALRGLSVRVVRESTQSQEVTATVVDLDARISNLRASEEALVQIMDRSGRIEDVLAVQLRLEDVRGQIERLEAQRNNLSDQAALSTLAVTWITPVAAVSVAQQGWDLGTEVDAALAQTVQALQGVASFGIWALVVVLPLLALPLLLVAAVYVTLRRRLRDGDDDGAAVVSGTTSE